MKFRKIQHCNWYHIKYYWYNIFINATLLFYGNCDQAFVYVSPKYMTNTRTASNFLCILDWMLVVFNIQMYPVFDHIFQFILLINTQKTV